jgi:hypothetical protein
MSLEYLRRDIPWLASSCLRLVSVSLLYCSVSHFCPITMMLLVSFSSHY